MHSAPFFELDALEQVSGPSFGRDMAKNKTSIIIFIPLFDCYILSVSGLIGAGLGGCPDSPLAGPPAGAAHGFGGAAAPP